MAKENGAVSAVLRSKIGREQLISRRRIRLCVVGKTSMCKGSSDGILLASGIGPMWGPANFALKTRKKLDFCQIVADYLNCISNSHCGQAGSQL